MSLKIFKWIHGMKITQALFSSHPKADISVKDAAIKTADFLSQVLTIITQADTVLQMAKLQALLGGKLEELIKAAQGLLPSLIDKLDQVSTIPDIAVELRDYRFAQDDKTNDLLHNLTTDVALVFADGVISVSDTAFILLILADFER